MHLLGEQRLRAKKEDVWVWKDGEIKVYTVKSAYKMLKEEIQANEKELFVSFWRIKAQPSTHITTWRVLEDKISSKENLMRRGINMINNICSMYGKEEETSSHLFV